MPPDIILPYRAVETTYPDTPTPSEQRDHDRLIDREEFARRLAVGTSTFDRLRAAGRVGPRVIRVGGAVRFHLAEVMAWIATPAAGGDLHTVETWPAVWPTLHRTAGRTGR